MNWKIHNKALVYDGHFKLARYQLSHEKYDGDSTPLFYRELVGRNNAVAMVAYDPDEDQIVLVEQFRIGAIEEEQPWLIEIVAGLIEPDEAPEQVVIRESEEEIGCSPSELIKIAGFYTSPGGNSEWIELFIGKISVHELAESGGLEDEAEDIRIIVLPADEIPYMLATGEVRSAIAIIGLQWFVANRENIRSQWLS